MPPLDIDDIRSGRRRAWDKLKDPEEKKRLEKEAREKDPEYKKKLSAMRRREMGKVDDRERDHEEFLRVRRQVIIFASVLVSGVLLLAGLKLGWSLLAERRIQKQLETLAVQVEDGKPYASFKNPVEAWASWRSAWVRKDAAALYGTFSRGKQGRELGRQGDQSYIKFLQGRMDHGAMDPDRHVAMSFSHPELLLNPRGDQRTGTLAVLKAKIPAFGAAKGSRPAPEATWVLVLSYDARQKLWRVEDVRHGSTWRDGWRHVNQIPVNRSARAAEATDGI